MRRPTMTFSFRPRRWSTAPWMEASVSTRVVSWNDAAEMNESVESDALVMPSSSGRPVAGLPPLAIVFSFSSRKTFAAIGDRLLVLFAEAELVDLLFQQERGIAHVFHFHPAHHLAHDHLNVLVADVDALQAVNLLDFVHQVGLQFLFAQHGQNVVRVQRTIHQRLASADALAFLHIDVNGTRHLGLFFGAVVGHYIDLALAFGNVAKLHHTIDLADDRGFAGLAGFEQFHHAWQTTRDVLGLGGFARDLRQHIARSYRVTVLNHQVSA